MKSMYSLPSSSMRVEPVPRAIASPAMRAKDWLPGATCRRSWATMRCDRGPTSRRSVMVAGAARPEDSAGGLRHGATWLRPSHHSPFQRGAARPEDSVGGLRQGATWLRPSWHYSFHSRPGSRNRSARWDAMRDRKSTRLNSSHGYISYAVFCLKKTTWCPFCRRFKQEFDELAARRPRRFAAVDLRA